MDYLSGWCKSERRLDGCTAIVTGANGGIGRETVMDFYKRGARVILACRNMDRAEEARRDIAKRAKHNAKNGTLVTEHLDLCSLKSVRKFANKVLTNEKRIQILVNNAGVMCCPQSRTEDNFETHIGSNHFGHAMLTLLLLPKLIESAPSRIIFVSSDVHYFHKIDLDDINYTKTSPYDPLEAYSRSKIANVIFTKALALKLKEHNISGVTTYCVHPGVVFTDIDRHFPAGISWAFRLPLTRWLWKSPLCGAQTTLHCALDDACQHETGLYYADCAPCPPSSYCEDVQITLRLWDLTIQMLGLENYDPFQHHNPNSTILYPTIFNEVHKKFFD